MKNRLLPKPQSIKKIGTYIKLDKVSLILDEALDSDLKNNLIDTLEKHQIEIDENAAYKVIVSLAGKDKGVIKTLESTFKRVDIAKYGEEAYQLYIDNDFILINASSNQGAYYASKTLASLIDGKRIASLDIIDYPTMSVRGVIEGFYGTPWTTEQRLEQFKFYGDMKINTYIYAPKDDPYHRTLWREPYPEDQLERMTKLIEGSKRNKVNFVFAISPGNDIDLVGENKEKDFETLIQKSQTLYNMGVRSFSIYFDDILNKDGTNQANLLNKFQNEFIQKYDDITPLITVPTEYDTFAMVGHGPISTYTKNFSETLQDDIHVMWTGSVIVSEYLTMENARFVNEIYGDNIALWWNYPVTDYQKEKLALGPIVDIDKGIDEYVDYFILNPMEHAELSKISLATGADYSWNPHEYDAEVSLNNTLDILYGDLKEEMKIFSNHSSRMSKAWDVGRQDAPELQEMFTKYWRCVGEGKGVTELQNYLSIELNKIIKASEVLLDKLPENILAEGKSNIIKLGLLGKIGLKALEMNLAQIMNNERDYGILKEEILSSGYNSGKEVSEGVLVAFIDQVLNFNISPKVSFSLTENFVGVNKKINLFNESSLITRDISWNFKGATVHNDSNECPVISYEKEGLYTIEMYGENTKGKDVLIAKDFITVTSLADKEKTNLSQGKPVKTSSNCTDDERGEYAVDGNIRSKWCADAEGIHSIIIDLESISLICSINIHHSEAGGEPKASNTKDYSISISNDNLVYEKVVDVKDNTKGITADKIKASHARYLKIEISKPTQNTDKAARIYEIEVLGYEGKQKLFSSH